MKDTEFAPWLERELASRADAECVETMAEFRRATRAVTKAGQIKGGVRHEKDDRFRIDDRSRYVLGWSNERKINVLLDRAAELAGQLAEAERIRAGHDAVAKAAVVRGQLLAGLDQTRDFREIDYQSAVNQNTIREIAQFQAQLNRQSDLIRERIDTINTSLVGVDYNPGRYIRLEPQQTPSIEIRDFRTDLRACTDNAVSPGSADDQYSEQKFLQVKRIIERFRGREGQSEADQKWTRLVTDVRNWYTFTASERYREDDSEYETYADSGGKSGGQKEKLAYTILAASLAYQFKLEWGAAKSRTFRFAVIDEAFGRGSDESTRFALELFGRLGLQLLIVTPLQKIHVIEPHVSAVGFVDNPTSRYSRLRTLTIEEYRAERLAHVIGASIAAAVA